MITVPRRGSRALDELTPAERYDRLARAFQHAATKADKYHVLFLRTAEENERLTAQGQELVGMSDRLARAERALDDLRDGHDALSGPEGGRRAPNDESAVEALKQDVVRLAAELARERGERAAAFEAAERVAKLNEEVRGALDTLTAHKQDIEEQTTLTNGAVERVRDDLEVQHRRLIQASARLEALSTTVDALRAEREDARKHGGSGSEIIAAFETSRSSVESLAASVRCASESLKEAHSQLAAIRNELGEAVSSLGKVRREIDEERSARGNAEREYDRLRMRVEDLAAGLEEIKYGAAPIGTPLHGAAPIGTPLHGAAPIGTPLSSAEAPAMSEAALSGEFSEEEVATDAAERGLDASDGEVVAAEVIDENSESAQQMMLNAFLRFMHSSPRDKK
jgi:chromosome segregation ATPase